ncbi:MAG: hypothetical protein QXQ14_03240 [Candidatus Aenigmatarchaeota archaeon]
MSLEEIHSVPCEDDCCAYVADIIFGKKCIGEPLGKWIDVIKNIIKRKNKVGIVDNDNLQIKKLEEYNFKLIKDFSDYKFRIFENNNRYIIVLDKDCEIFLGVKNKIRSKENENISNINICLLKNAIREILNI